MECRRTALIRLAAAVTSALVLAACAPSPEGLKRAAAAGAVYDPARPFPESAFTSNQGLSLHYRHWLPADGVTPRGRVLLIHGFGASTFSFRNQVPDLLAAGWELAALDHPPFGFSGKETDYSRFERATLLWAVPDALGWDGPVVLIGHSLGGQYAAAMAAERPERVSRLVILAGALRGVSMSPGAPALFGGFDEGSLERMIHDWFFVRDALARVAGRAVDDEVVDGYAAPYQVPGGSRALLAWTKGMRNQPAIPLGRIAAPCLLIWGRDDAVVPVGVGREAVRAIPGARLVELPGEGHIVHELRPDLVNPPILEFLAH